MGLGNVVIIYADSASHIREITAHGIQPFQSAEDWLTEQNIMFFRVLDVQY